jgi:Family of unknown function (DUF5681)
MSKEHLKRFAFKPGQSGNPNGRPKGSRNMLAETFLADVYAEWDNGGKEAIKKMAGNVAVWFLLAAFAWAILTAIMTIREIG